MHLCGCVVFFVLIISVAQSFVMPSARRDLSKARSKSPRSPRAKSPAAPRSRSRSAPLKMSTRSSVEASAAGGKKKSSGSGLKRFSIVLIFSLILSQALSFLASGSKSAFTYLRTSSIAIIGAQLLVWLHASGVVFGNTPTEHYYDLIGSVTNVSAIAASIYFNGGWARLSQRQKALSAFVIIWATRLGIFLFSRVQVAGKDSRFDEMKKVPLAFAVAWVLQGLWVFITALPVTSLNALGGSGTSLGTQDYIGLSLWVIGFGFELLADHQKTQFKAVKGNKGKFINTGLWAISRHPNYFGEMLLWFGAYIVANGGMTSPLQKFVTFFCPVFVSLLLIFVSGVNLLEKSSDARFGTSKGYEEYKTSTPVLIPFVGRAGDASF